MCHVRVTLYYGELFTSKGNVIYSGNEIYLTLMEHNYLKYFGKVYLTQTPSFYHRVANLHSQNTTVTFVYITG